MTICYLALGSNLGDRVDLLKKAVQLLSEEEKINVLAQSDIYETEPYGDVPQDNYLNAVVKIETTLAPIELLDTTQKIELELGRERLIRWGPRTIDIDLILMDGVTYQDERLTIPHIEVAKRSFVLIPLKDVYEKTALFGKNIEQLISETGNQDEVWKSRESW